MFIYLISVWATAIVGGRKLISFPTHVSFLFQFL